MPRSPVVVSVPHAGRDYPDALLARLRVPPDQLLPLEDRLVDRVAAAACRDEVLFVARRPRAWIDLNRGEHERDPRVDEGAQRTGTPLLSTRVRGGLGLVPRRGAAGIDLWSARWSAADVLSRIHADHRPYHAAIADALLAARRHFGIAILLDVHSMPPLPGKRPARVVIGDRFGKAAGARFVGRVEGAAQRCGLPTALNTPYAGGHVLERHAAPGKGIHCIQLELDRTLYLDADLRELGDGFTATVALVRSAIDALADEALPQPVAAE